MAPVILPFVVLISGLGVLYCAVELYKFLRSEIARLDDTVTELDDTVTELNERVQTMADAGRKRINYQTLEALEDLCAALDVMDRELEFDKSLIANARAHAFKARNPQK